MHVKQFCADNGVGILFKILVLVAPFAAQSLTLHQIKLATTV